MLRGERGEPTGGREAGRAGQKRRIRERRKEELDGRAGEERVGKDVRQREVDQKSLTERE